MQRPSKITLLKSPRIHVLWLFPGHLQGAGTGLGRDALYIPFHRFSVRRAWPWVFFRKRPATRPFPPNRGFVTIIENAILRGSGMTEVGIHFRQNGKSSTILIEDNGPGIPAGEKERIFEWEYKGKGGPGLFLAREILSITGISIKETGDPATGARFEISVSEGDHRIGQTI